MGRLSINNRWEQTSGPHFSVVSLHALPPGSCLVPDLVSLGDRFYLPSCNKPFPSQVGFGQCSVTVTETKLHTELTLGLFLAFSPSLLSFLPTLHPFMFSIPFLLETGYWIPTFNDFEMWGQALTICHMLRKTKAKNRLTSGWSHLKDNNTMSWKKEPSTGWVSR